MPFASGARLTFIALLAASWLGPAPAAGQGQEAAADPYVAPRTPDGRPDLQGKWTMATFTPLERPERFGDRAFLTEEEAAELRALFTVDGVNPLARAAFAEADPELRREKTVQTQENIHYDNAIWLTEERRKGLSSLRTSLIVDPPNGRIPAFTSTAQEREERRLVTREHLARSRPNPVFDSYETRSLQERCLVWRHEGPPMLPPSYNDILQIFQTPDHLVIFQEMSNNPPRVVERFTRTGADEIVYEFTVEDPTSWMRPWSAHIPMASTDEMLFEYACHEGNHDIANILAMSRNLDKQAADKAR